MKFSIRKFVKSFSYAFFGICEVFHKEQNFKVHCLIGLVALLLGWFFHISATEWCFLIVVIALVLASEMVNTAIENLCDVAEPNQNEIIRVVKDISAGMVLICALGALGVGVVIFLPKLLKLL
ncbi:MAG: diacylglycerol kinase family protein [Clostridia bacterium]|nr:diacylglycerol kinase family protein [Clostridia bacterium]